MGSLIVTDIGELVTADGSGVGEPALGLVHDAEIVVVGHEVVYAGPRGGGPRPADLPPPVAIDSVDGRLVSPGLCDPHTHPLWAGERTREFDLRNQGVRYAEIQRQGGGILATVRATTAASDEALIAGMRARLHRMLAQGVTRCEAKTGYGLLPAAELRLLDLLVQAAAGQPVSVSPTLLCHVPPPGLSPAERADLVAALAAILPEAKRRGAEALDVYCDEGAFTLAETEFLLRAGRAAGLRLRCHAEQFTHTGAAERAACLGATSVEHLEQIDPAGVVALARAGTVANLLPGAALTLRLPWPDARRLIDAGVRVALGTDLNPGTSLSESLPLMMTLACTQMGMSCAEAWLAVTIHAAHAVGSSGRLRAGARADIVVWDAEGYREVCQHFGVPLAQRVYIAGQLVWEAAPGPAR
ncbi:MAG: imidazolonepropionase [Myxococcales bacterium]|nr:imidazolonepropionase [Myxococcota bacterium]MDW8283366.1 imidazolonepropionase [Myxococcales bacterium]